MDEVLQPSVDEPSEPLNSASPCALSGTSGVSMTIGVAEAGPQIRVPLTSVTAPGVPIVLPPRGQVRGFQIPHSRSRD